MNSAKTRSEQSPPTILRAAWVFPISSRPLRDAAVVFRDGTITEVGAAKDLTGRHPNATVVDLDNCALLPGLINAHTHLELSLIRPSSSPGPNGFVGWIQGVMSQAPAEMTVQTAVNQGVNQCLKFGVTCVGDISRQCDLTRPVLAKSPIGAVSFGEIQAMARRRHFLESRLEKAADSKFQTERLQIGISPHAPYSIEPLGYQRCLEIARSRRMPLCTHLAENPFEADFLANHSGPFRDLWQWLDGWDDQVPKFAGGPIRFAESLGLLDYPTLLAHANYCDDDELAILARGQASVVYCPRTHQFFSHPPHRWNDMLACGINVAIGTDSCASSGDLNLLADARLIHQQSPSTPASRIFEMITTRAARALGLSDAGRLQPGATADIIAFDTHGNDPFTEILESEIIPRHVWIDGINSTVA